MQLAAKSIRSFQNTYAGSDRRRSLKLYVPALVPEKFVCCQNFALHHISFAAYTIIFSFWPQSLSLITCVQLMRDLATYFARAIFFASTESFTHTELIHQVLTRPCTWHVDDRLQEERLHLTHRLPPNTHAPSCPSRPCFDDQPVPLNSAVLA